MEALGEQYGLSDLRHLITTGKSHFTAEDPFPGHHRGRLSDQSMAGGEVMMVQLPPQLQQGFHEQQFCCDDGSGGRGGGGGGGGGVFYEEGCSKGRWPRQETLTLLEIRARLDYKFREASHKAPLIMAEEHGYQRSGKKCREKLENLYKYYKKTKEGKAGRQDGKHYRFFRQLEALYGDKQITPPITDSNTTYSIINNHQHQLHHCFPPTAAPKLSESLSLSNYSSDDFLESSSSDGEDDRREEFVDSQMRRFIEVQEAFLDKMLKTLENKEQERMMREEAWRMEEAARLEREHRFWAVERAWVEARDVALMQALSKLTGDDHMQWRETEITSEALGEAWRAEQKDGAEPTERSKADPSVGEFV
ncbi:Trihelix transcription factor PTL [Acorus calamus]|uniref:Trihelix transcription factor PTL n=1 Tax=Acorus calamus TaxID=4465 RepID=A0AAV9DIK7_ACOCL|nr:Trihelix transcription factor PTL [Acorus calamus]